MIGPVTRTTSTTSRPADDALRHRSPRTFGRRRLHAARGVTLLELLIVIGIVMTLMAIAVPMVTSTLDRQRLESVSEEIIGALLMARAHAQAEGVTVEIVLDAGSAQRDDERRPMRMLAREIDLHAPTFDDEEGPPPLRRAWADVSIEWPLRLGVAAPEDDFEADPDSLNPGAGSGAERSRPRSGGVWSTTRDVVARERLVVFAADGSALIAPRLRVDDRASKSIEIVINPFTGLPRRVSEQATGRSATSTAPVDDALPGSEDE